MNRLVERRRNLPAFSIGLGELEVLWDRMIAVFGPGEPDGAFVKISLRSEELEFRAPDELRNYAELRGGSRSFRSTSTKVVAFSTCFLASCPSPCHSFSPKAKRRLGPPGQ